EQCSHGAQFRKGFRQLLRLSQYELFVEKSHQGICHNIESQSGDGSDQAPLKHIFFICTFVNMSDPVSYQSGDQTDTELQHKSLRRNCYIYGIHDIRDPHSHCSGNSSVPSAQKKRRQHTESISQMNRCGVSSRHRYLNLQECKYHITESSHKSCLCKFYDHVVLTVHNNCPLFLIFYIDIILSDCAF